MSGGYFDYKQYEITRIADEIQNLIENNNIKNDYDYANNFSEQTIAEFKKAIVVLRMAQVYARELIGLYPVTMVKTIFMSV